jgi:Asp-tRNA(Asn)/Glu-tRNA(Gln) amidotransferase C subunit|tara:strand:+ start:992 stop:1267 length:276 start_codon:yes stop_codon:yes gene_type:complete
MDFLFHKVSEEEKEDIKKEAKSIMENFSEKLSKVDDKIPEPHVEREEFERGEESTFSPAQPQENENDFRKRMFENAPKKSKDFILAEKKGW